MISVDLSFYEIISPVLQGMNSMFHGCLDECKKLLTKVTNPHSSSSSYSASAPAQVLGHLPTAGDVVNQILSTMNANKLLYACAVDLVGTRPLLSAASAVA